MHKYQSMHNLSELMEEREIQRRRSTIDLTSPELVNLLAGSPPSPGSPAGHPTAGVESDSTQVNVPLPVNTDTSVGVTLPPMESQPMEAQSTNENCVADLGTDHAQCSSARRAALRAESICISPDSSFGQKLIMDPDVVGTLNPPGDKDVLLTFHGARAKKGGGWSTSP